ncbi:HNH endonuclease [Bacillus gaemokensis]|uniref:Putative HNH nuclease YajD n=1 Tax=Bacillus gaemokensis TaxID=574375 RepID=A0A073KGZ1_9BACI|nr:HNH endonuclease signature motif containing protein [Bacillus gaemokensis]KEK25707.1 HNH endonuclease [Bacillus gaemokensis]KYG38524.1 HNH endonuclease [Bacillus gaemokensis]
MEKREFINLIKTDKLMKFYKSKEWRQLRVKVLQRDNYECCMCRDKGKYRKADCVHHIKEVKEYPELALTFENLKSLCNQCHNEVHDRLKAQDKPPAFVNEERW